MGTRGLHGIVADNKEYLTYNHFDSYPDGLGVEVLAFARSINPHELRALVEGVTLIDEHEEPTRQQIQNLKRAGISAPENVSTGTDWYSWLRSLQGDFMGYLNVGYLPDSSSFAQDSLFCEWAYVIDLDQEVFEVYEGFVTEPHEDGRFAKKGDGRPSAGGITYYPVRLIKTFPLNDLPDDGQFVTEVMAASRHEDES